MGDADAAGFYIPHKGLRGAHRSCHRPRTLPADIRAAAGAAPGRSVYIKEREVLALIARRFADVLAPLIRARKLGLLVYQFPPWFDYKERNFDYMLLCKELAAPLPMAVEFRHGSWLSAARAPSALAFLREHGLTYVAADEPQYGMAATVPFVPAVTTETAYFRFHGRNAANWLKKGVPTTLRYDYLYSDEELEEFLPAIREADRQAKKTYAMFNNCHKSSAAVNALRLKELINK